jgi:DNA-binding protein HU-beta
MNKGELIDKIVDKTGLKKADASTALDATLDAIKDALKEGEKVTLVGFCTFSTSFTAARNGINPQNKSTVKIEEKVKVKFKAGKILADTVNTERLRNKLKPKQ